MMIVGCYLVSDSCVSFIHYFGNITMLFFDIDIGCVIGEQQSYATEITNGRWMSQTLENTRQSIFLGGVRTYHS
jgi:hypothetical protein